jgi:hypothetical protein
LLQMNLLEHVLPLEKIDNTLDMCITQINVWLC